MPVDSPKDSKPLKEIKQMLETEKNSANKKETLEKLEYEKFTTRNGFRRKKGDSPFVYNLNLKVKKEKKHPTSLILILGLELLGVETLQQYI